MTIVAPLGWYVVVTGIGECVRAELAATPAGAPARVCTALAGQVADDDCCAGQLAVTVNRVYPSRVFPADASDDPVQDMCGPPLEVADITVRVTRCVPVMDEQGQPPACADLAAATATWMRDVHAVRRAVGCCLQAMLDADTIDTFAVGSSVASGPDGGCLAGDTTIKVALPACLCPQ